MRSWSIVKTVLNVALLLQMRFLLAFRAALSAPRGIRRYGARSFKQPAFRAICPKSRYSYNFRGSLLQLFLASL